MALPEMIKIKQIFNNNKINNIDNEIKNQLHKIPHNINKGSNIAIAVGSRGIANIKTIVKNVVDSVKGEKANPFVIPAMGSHGGATAEGQKKILKSYGITEDFLKAPIRSSMEVVELPNNGVTNKIYIDKIASEADGIIIINRIKSHTSFHGTYESVP